MKKKYQIFISSTYEDLKEERKKVQETILELYQFPIGMEMFSASSKEQWQIIQETIDSSDFYVLIIGDRYGSVIETGEDKGISYTEKEFNYAKKIGLPIIVLIKDDSIPIKTEYVESDEKRQKLLEFKNKAKTGRMVKWWTSPENLAKQFSIALSKEMADCNQPGWIRYGKEFVKFDKQVNDLQKRIKELEEENKRLKINQQRMPKLNLEIDGMENDTLKLDYYDPGTAPIESECHPLSLDDVPDILKKMVTPKDIEQYNEALPNQRTIREYCSEYKNYKQYTEGNFPLNINIVNDGNLKANNVSVEIEFPPELKIVSKKTIDKMEEPEQPNIPENPIDKAYAKKFFGPAYYGMKNDFANNMAFSINPKILSGELLHATIPKQESRSAILEENTIKIWENNLVHTFVNTFDEFCIVAKEKGNYQIEYRLFCEEYTEDVVRCFTVIVG